MSSPEASLNILLINEHPDELKLVTSSLRLLVALPLVELPAADGAG